MTPLLLTIDQMLRAEGLFRAAAGPVSMSIRQRVRTQLWVIAACGMVYGACMGSFGGVFGDGWRQMLVSAAKVPLLFTVAFLLCVPSFYVLNAVAGLHQDFPRTLDALFGFQSIAAIVLAAAAPITAFMNLTTSHYPFILLWNGLRFFVASLAGHFMMRRYYEPLVRRHPRHATLRRVWMLLYTFVGIQMAWVLRPFVGSPGMPVQFFRAEAWGNAYIEVLQLVLNAFGFTPNS